MCMYHCLYFYLPYVCRFLQRSEDSAESSGAGVTGRFELPNMGARTQFGSPGRVASTLN